jgi:hypothetical protein
MRHLFPPILKLPKNRKATSPSIDAIDPPPAGAG